MDAARAARARELRRAARGRRAPRDRLRPRADRRADGRSLEPYQDAWLEEEAELLRALRPRRRGAPTPAAMRAEVASPTYRGGAVGPRRAAALARPGQARRRAARRGACGAGVRVLRAHAARRRSTRRRTAWSVRDRARGAVRARRVLLATSAFPPLVRAIRRYVVPVYDYVLMTEPLSARAARRRSAGARRQGLGDGGNQFHYYRLTRDDRILWGGYDAVYRFGGPGRAHDLDDHDATFARARAALLHDVPAARGRCASRTAGAARSTPAAASRCSSAPRTAGASPTPSATPGSASAPTRFGARVALDLLDGRDTEATRAALRAPQAGAVPARAAPRRRSIQLTRNRLAAADRREGRRGLWLRHARPPRARLRLLEVP